MKKKLTLLLITILSTGLAAKADFAMTNSSDYTGDAFFGAPKFVEDEPSGNKQEMTGTVPPLKKLRLMVKEKIKEQNSKDYILAPVQEPTTADSYTETSKYASKEETNDFEDMSSADIMQGEITEENATVKKGFFKKKQKKAQAEQTEDIILDCDDVKYDTEKYLIKARGNVVVTFVKQDIVVKSDIMTFDRANNTLKAEGNVQIIKNNQVTTGEYIFIDMNEENGLIEAPETQTADIEMHAKKGYAYGDKLVYEFGSMDIKGAMPIRFIPATNMPQTRDMIIPENEKLSMQMKEGLVNVKTSSIKITQKGDLETIAFKKFGLYSKDKVLFKIPAVKLYTNKNHDYGESNLWEIGSYRGMGVYTGPGFVFELPKGSVLKAMPIVNYYKGFGIGAYGRFSSGTNTTTAAYATAGSKIIVEGRQRLDDHLQLLYGMNSYMDEWFMGSRRPKYGIGLVYQDGYASEDFLLKGRASSYAHRVDAGFYQDLDYDNSFEGLQGNNISTARFRYMAQANQELFKYENRENCTAFKFSILSQLSASLYGTGDTQVVGRIAPVLHTQYKRWMQDLGYYFAAYDDNTPMPVFDTYRHGSQSIYVREYLRLNRLLTLSWFGAINVLGDTPDGKRFTENGFYVSIGPDDVKFSVGYDFIRQTLYCGVELDTDARGTKVDFDRFEITQDKKAKEEKKYEEEKSEKAPMGPKALKNAIVEDVKDMENVL